MTEQRRHFLVRLRPRGETLYVSQSRTVLATRRDGFIIGGPDHGLFTHQTRLLSHYRYLIDGQPLLPVALSNVKQHSWLGYYIQLRPGIDAGEPDHGSGQISEVSQQTLELRLSRYVGAGMHAELWHWTGDKELIRPLLDPALKALHWLDDYGDLDGDGFYEYQTRSIQGVENQAWKDSGDAIVYEDGSQVKPPIATRAEQGFVYIAKLLLSEVLWWLDAKQEAKRLYHEAAELKKRFNQAFWLEEEGFFALGLDAQKRPIRSITSNPGHCLATGIMDTSLARRTADRLMPHDLFSGWGIRTLSSQHPAYNPYSYHRGSVWPVEQGTFALAFMRYGLHQHLERLCRAQFDATALFDWYRLPEAFSGYPRDAEHPFPAFYPKANSPQAWSASAVFCFVQALLGLYPYAPLNMLFLDPHLPEWLPEITLGNLHVGDAVATIRFYRQPGGASSYRVLDKRGPLHIIRQPSPWSLTASVAERLKDALVSLLPGK